MSSCNKKKKLEAFNNIDLQNYQNKINENLNINIIESSSNINDISKNSVTTDNLAITSTENNTIIDDPNEKIVTLTFYFAYIFLITTGTICFIEALRTSDNNVRHVMNLETCISIVAGYFYGVFVKLLQNTKESGKPIPYAKINNMRYTDWFISTPIMLLVLCMVLGMENNKKVKFTTLMIILLLNFAMLTMGYLGEIGLTSKVIGLIGGFVWFFAMYGVIWQTFMRNKRTRQSIIIYLLFIVLWSLYGVAYMSGQVTRVISYNILDLVAKAFVGIFFWMYFTKVVKI